MTQRTVAIYNGKYIGMETVYTAIKELQINILDKLKELREKVRIMNCSVLVDVVRILFWLQGIRIFENNILEKKQESVNMSVRCRWMVRALYT